jgi:hypothetical protein
MTAKRFCLTVLVAMVLAFEWGPSSAATSEPAASASDNDSYDVTARWLTRYVPDLAQALNRSGAGQATLGFSITNCVVDWKTEVTLPSQRRMKFAFSIPFDKVTRVEAVTNFDGDPFVIRMFGPVHQTAPTVKDLSDQPVGVSSQDASDQIARALQRLATLCQLPNAGQ